jgi:hypothetical protein
VLSAAGLVCDEGCDEVLKQTSRSARESYSNLTRRVNGFRRRRKVVDMTLDAFRNTTQPDICTAGQDRKELRGDRREGQAVRVMGFLWKAKREGAESCNCKLDANGTAGELITDIHMVLTDKPDDPEATSVTAEVTPRVRAKRPHPSLDSLSARLGNVLATKTKTAGAVPP